MHLLQPALEWIGVSRDSSEAWRATVQVQGQQFFLGRAFRSAEAAARAVDRATIAIEGRVGVATNFPLSSYPPEVSDGCCSRPTGRHSDMLLLVEAFSCSERRYRRMRKRNGASKAWLVRAGGRAAVGRGTRRLPVRPPQAGGPFVCPWQRRGHLCYLLYHLVYVCIAMLWSHLSVSGEEHPPSDAPSWRCLGCRAA